MVPKLYAKVVGLLNGKYMLVENSEQTIRDNSSRKFIRTKLKEDNWRKILFIELAFFQFHPSRWKQ